MDNQEEMHDVRSRNWTLLRDHLYNIWQSKIYRACDNCLTDLPCSQRIACTAIQWTKTRPLYCW